MSFDAGGENERGSVLVLEGVGVVLQEAVAEGVGHRAVGNLAP